jgi:glycosyltransferase involved in cell wall biosynthesis
MECSVIISTRNRADALEKTLVTFSRIRIPAGWSVELIVADNGSTDRTVEVVKKADLFNFTVRYLYEGKPGKSQALNSALAIAKGQVFLFTDDDVEPAENWLSEMAMPIFRKECEGTVGNIRLAENLLRPWMDSSHRHRLAAPDVPSLEVIGANMGFHRSVFDRIPAFDPELGPGASGLGEETLFALQFLQAGFRLRSVPGALVVHHPEESRLRRSHWLAGSRKHGRTAGYIIHHWRHETLKMVHFRLSYLQMKLILRRFAQPPPKLEEDGCPSWELSYVANIEKLRCYLSERRRPRNYLRYGLKKLIVSEKERITAV